MMKGNKMSGVEILLNDSRGVYIPQNFAENFNMKDWGVIDEERDVLLAGPSPENESYWDVWHDVLSNSSYKDKNDNIWYLTQDGDLFAYCDPLMTDEEYENFFGEPRYV